MRELILVVLGVVTVVAVTACRSSGTQERGPALSPERQSLEDSARLTDYMAGVDDRISHTTEPRHKILRAVQADWIAAVKRLQDRGVLVVGMSQQAVVELLGEPTKRKGKYLQWYFSSPMHINPGFVAYVADEVVESFQWTSY